jgi:sec-independent protein translocase protein TatA
MMGGLSIWHWLIVIAVVAVVFGGRGKLSGLMGDAAKGIRAFQDGLKGGEGDKVVEDPAKPLPRTESEKDKIVN